MTQHLILFLVALIANLLSALAGGGAGLLQLPALLFLGLPFGTALATHKIASIALGVGATLRHAKEEPLHWRFSAFILMAGLPGVILGAHFILHINDNLAKLLLGLMTVSAGLYSWSQKQLGQHANALHRNWQGMALGGLVLFAIGFLNGSLTSGTGLFVTLWLIRWFGLDYKRAVTYTLILVGLFWNGCGALTLGLQTPIKWSWLPALLFGSFVGGYVGAHLSIVNGNRFIKYAFEIMTIIVGTKLIVDGFIG